MRGLILWRLFLAAIVMTVFMAFALAQECGDHDPCHGCGCAGGPGYRGPNGRCVGFRQLDAVCGTPPTLRCVFENAPGTGANRQCALAPRKRAPRGKSRSPTPPDAGAGASKGGPS